MSVACRPCLPFPVSVLSYPSLLSEPSESDPLDVVVSSSVSCAASSSASPLIRSPKLRSRTTLSTSAAASRSSASASVWPCVRPNRRRTFASYCTFSR